MARSPVDGEQRDALIEGDDEAEAGDLDGADDHRRLRGVGPAHCGLGSPPDSRSPRILGDIPAWNAA
jgi:hypothetical protein